MLSLKLEMSQMPDFSEIRKFADNASADIFVGFLSGKMHVETKHKNKDGEYRDYGGKEPTFQNVENAELAKRLSFGTATIPARPFLEDGLLSKKDELKKEIEVQLENLKAGKLANWDKVGSKAVGAITEFVRGGYYKSQIPNAKSTIEYKGSDTPLIDGGDLIGSLEYVVE